MRYIGIVSDIECRADGELPHERKDILTVHGSHPAVIIMFDNFLLLQLRNFASVKIRRFFYVGKK